MQHTRHPPTTAIIPQLFLTWVIVPLDSVATKSESTKRNDGGRFAATTRTTSTCVWSELATVLSAMDGSCFTRNAAWPVLPVAGAKDNRPAPSSAGGVANKSRGNVMFCCGTWGRGGEVRSMYNVYGSSVLRYGQHDT